MKNKPDNEQFCFGYAGVARLFSCSRSKAYQLIHTTIAPAVYQEGRIIMVDKAQALQLVKDNTLRNQAERRAQAEK